MTVEQYTALLRLLCFIIFAIMGIWIVIGIMAFTFKGSFERLETKVSENNDLLNNAQIYEAPE